MRTQHLAALLGLALVAVAAVFMFSGVRRDGLDCGTAFRDSGRAEHTDIVNSYSGLPGTRIQADCDAARSTRATLTLALGVPGLVLLAGGGLWVLTERNQLHEQL